MPKQQNWEKVITEMWETNRGKSEDVFTLKEFLEEIHAFVSDVSQEGYKKGYTKGAFEQLQVSQQYLEEERTKAHQKGYEEGLEEGIKDGYNNFQEMKDKLREETINAVLPEKDNDEVNEFNYIRQEIINKAKEKFNINLLTEK